MQSRTYRNCHPTTLSGLNSMFLTQRGIVCVCVLFASPARAERIGEYCLDDLYTGAQSVACTTSDIDLAVSSLLVQEDCRSGTFQSARVAIQFEISSNADSRWDVSLVFGLNGISAVSEGEMCYHDILPTPQSLIFGGSSDSRELQQGISDGPWTDLDGDACGDLVQGGGVYKTIQLEFACNDSNQNGMIDLPYCTAWKLNGDEVCLSEADAGLAGPSKCHCETLELPLAPAYVQFTMNTASPFVIPGGSASFTLLAVSAGVENLANVVLNDPICDSLSTATGDDGDNILESEETWSWTCGVDNVTGEFINSATLSATTVVSSTQVEEVATASVSVLNDIFADGFETENP